MAGKTIRSHKERVRQANDTLKNHPRYKNERISIVDREAFVEYYLLEDIVRLYNNRLNGERAYVPQGRADERGQQSNIEKFSAIISVFNAAIGAARSAINSGDYKKVWKAIPEGALMAASKSVKNLPELKRLAVELLRELSVDTIESVDVNAELDEALDDLDMHEQNVRKIRNLSPSMGEIEEVIRAAEAAIPDRKRNSRLDPNT